jgi:hypothetical protein
VVLAKNVDGLVAESFGLLEAIYAFQAVSTIRHKLFLDVQTEKENVDTDRELAIPQQSDTRWVCKYVGVQYFKKRFVCVVQALDRLSHSVNKKDVFDDLLNVTTLRSRLSLQLMQATQLDIGSCRHVLD